MTSRKSGAWAIPAIRASGAARAAIAASCLLGVGLGLVATLAVNGGEANAARSLRTEGWSTYRNQRYGVEIAYPGGLLAPAGGRATEGGQLFQSRDGDARLLVGALSNDDKFTLESYRAFVKTETYGGARFDYERIGRNWFVVSGRRGALHFYQRVAFSCGGRLITSWAMTYPDAQRRRYDPLVEVIARTFKPGARGVEGCR